MRILLLTARYLPHRGGLETVVSQLGVGLRAAGNEVVIVTNRYPRSLPAQEWIDGIATKRFLFLLPEWRHLRDGRFDLWLAAIILFPFTLLRLYNLIRHMRPDVVNLHYIGTQAFFLWLVSYIYRFRMVVSLHGGDVDGEPHQSRFRLWLLRVITRRAHSVTACSRELLQQAIGLVPHIEQRGVVIYNGVDPVLFARIPPFAHRRSYILGVGQLLAHKGFDLLLTAFGQVCQQFPGVDLIIAGDGSERNILHALAEALNLPVEWLGRVDQETVAALMRGSAVIVIPSRREPFGIVGLEAMASGRPIVASRVGGLREALQGAEVNWFEPGNAVELAHLLTDILSCSSIDSIESNRLRAQAYNWSTVTQRYLREYVDAR